MRKDNINVLVFMKPAMLLAQCRCFMNETGAVLCNEDVLSGCIDSVFYTNGERILSCFYDSRLADKIPGR